MRVTHRMTGLINEEELAYLMIVSPQVKVGGFGYAVAWKKAPDLQNFIEGPKYAYLLNTVQC